MIPTTERIGLLAAGIAQLRLLERSDHRVTTAWHGAIAVLEERPIA